MINDVVPPYSPKFKPKTVTSTSNFQDNNKQSSSNIDEISIDENGNPQTSSISPAEMLNTPPDQPLNKKTPSKMKAFFRKLKWKNLSTKQRIIFIITAILVVSGIGTGAYALMSHHNNKPVATHKTSKPKPTTKPKIIVSTLTGLVIKDPSINARPVTGVMIENSDDARPQSGLDQVGVVFEAVAEAGITRFLALYQDSQPAYLGPVRSARPYYVQWDLGFDAAYAHVGGSPEALSDITSWNVHDLNQFYNANAYERVSSRAAPHNVYTSASQLNQLEASKGFNSSNFTGFVRKPDSISKTPNAASIDISPSSADFNSHYDFDTSANNYKRSEGGAPHMEVDASGNKTQITPKVIIAMVMQQGIEGDDYHTSYNVIGSGQAYVFQDGTVTIGTWQKTDNTSQITFTSSNNKPIALNAGQTWLVAVSSASQVSYK